MEAARDAALFQQNFYRSRHGSVPLRRNADLDMLAQMCAYYYQPMGMIDHSCPYYKSGKNFYFSEADGIGENGMGGGEGDIYEHLWSNLQMAIWGGWAFNRESYKYNFSDFKNAHFLSTGHFTQMIWRETTHFGFGYSVFKKKGKYGAISIFLYSPAGNVQSQDGSPYIMNVRPVIPGAKAVRSVNLNDWFF
ncbi:unnamed protein product [Orchesella dallaii]|uniref:SCP domain-containing protein n=1 Tax=Orchesella dallaii TaxID=48710 RepID=A0ABP1RYV7_9HEXA